MSVSEWKAREKEQRRNDIIDAAEKLFFLKGFDEVSMDDIAKEIKLNKATLYRYFMSKEALFFTVVLRGVRIHHTMLTQRVQNSGTGLERLIAVGNVSYDFVNKYPDYHRLTSYYISGRFDLSRLMKSDDMACLPSDEHLKLARLEEAAGSEKVQKIIQAHVACVPSDKAHKWVKLAETTESEVVREISRLRWGLFDTMRDAVKAGQEDGSIRSGLSPAEMAVFISIISSGLVSISSDYKCLLEYMGIDQDQFVGNSRTFLHRVLSK